MAITFLPNEYLQKAASEKVVKKLVTDDLTLSRAVASSLARTSILSKNKIEKIALKVIKQYKKKYKGELKDGASASAALEDTLNNRRLMVARVQDEIIYEVHQDIKQNYRGEWYEWLPSDAEIPDPLHQLKYGEKFRIGKGEMPGDRYGCRCGMRILVKEETLLLGDE